MNDTTSNRLSPELRDQTFRWIADDVDQDTRSELQAILAKAMGGVPGSVAELADRMTERLEFGTAGLRGPVRGGPNGMNSAVVIQTTAGVAAWLVQQGKAGGTVVLGRDARHGSEAFATAAAEVLIAAGFEVQVLPGPLPTPLLAFAVKQRKAVAGIQITASHNPAADNGYKLYDDTGAQIIPPADGEIERLIATMPGAITVPREPGALVLGEELLAAYLSTVAALIPATGEPRTLRIAATALHGVGAEVLQKALEQAGFTDLHFVAEQSTPDPDFPTVSFPNPEEPGATDLLLKLAKDVQADLAIALDPDADRCALGIPTKDDSWRMLRGDETGTLLGKHILSTIDRSTAVNPLVEPLVATTIVSSSQLGKIAAAHQVGYRETLTGFKWLARAGEGLIFAYEEALGLCVNPKFVRDKDGISAAVVAADLAASLRTQGQNLESKLDEIAVLYGVHLTDQISLRVEQSAARDALMAKLRATPPQQVAGVAVTFEDLRPEADVIRLQGEGLRIIVRPSGTEPKVKTYLEVVEPVTIKEELTTARQRAHDQLLQARTELELLLS